MTKYYKIIQNQNPNIHWIDSVSTVDYRFDDSVTTEDRDSIRNLLESPTMDLGFKHTSLYLAYSYKSKLLLLEFENSDSNSIFNIVDNLGSISILEASITRIVDDNMNLHNAVSYAQYTGTKAYNYTLSDKSKENLSQFIECVGDREHVVFSLTDAIKAQSIFASPQNLHEFSSDNLQEHYVCAQAQSINIAQYSTDPFDSIKTYLNAELNIPLDQINAALTGDYYYDLRPVFLD